jgi:hypothetical protein
MLSCILSYFIAITTHVCQRTNIFISLNSSNIYQSCNFSSFQQFWKYWRYCIRTLNIWNIGCTKNDYMFKANKSLLICPNKSHMRCGKIFYDKAWDILPHQILIPWGKKIILEIFHNVAWNIFKDFFLFTLTCLPTHLFTYSPPHHLLTLL